jgi:hypothetical protein
MKMRLEREGPTMHAASSCDPAPPEPPIAPNLPSSIKGMPPREAPSSSCAPSMRAKATRLAPGVDDRDIQRPASWRPV